MGALTDVTGVLPMRHEYKSPIYMIHFSRTETFSTRIGSKVTMSYTSPYPYTYQANGNTFEPVYIMMKKNTPVRYSLERPGLSSMVHFNRTETFSTRIGSKVSKSWKERKKTGLQILQS